MASEYGRKVNICLRFIEFLQITGSETDLKSHRLLEAVLYLVQLDKHCGYNTLASNRFQVALLVQEPNDPHRTLASLVDHLVCADLCLFWLCYIHLVEFSHLPRDLFDPACSKPSRIVCKDDFVFPWKPGGGTTYAFPRLLKLFHRKCAR